jgi:predicted RNA binding protein YcfA (HicA-like mRNA interferase family)
MRRERFINKIRDLGYKFKRDAWRIQVWKHPQTMHVIEPRKKDDLDDDWVRSVLRHAGCSKEDIEAFIRNHCN